MMNDPESSLEVVRLTGELDISRRDEVAAALEQVKAAPAVLVDLSDVPYADSTVLAELLLSRPALNEELWAEFTARRYERAKTVVDASNQLGQWLLDHEQGDVPGLIGRIAALLSQPA